MYNMYFGDSDKRRVIKLIIEDKQIMIIINKIKSHIHVAIPNIVSAIILIYSVTCLINVLVGTHEILHYLFENSRMCNSVYNALYYISFLGIFYFLKLLLLWIVNALTFISKPKLKLRTLLKLMLSILLFFYACIFIHHVSFSQYIWLAFMPIPL